MHILYVEDDPKIQAQTTTYLRSQNHQVTPFANMPNALNFALKGQFDVLLCDYRLHGSPNGLALAEQVRNLYPACPIVMISNFATVEDLSRGYDIDVDAYLKRPIGLEELLNKLYAAVERRRSKFQSADSEIVVGSLRIDKSQRIAMWHDEHLKVTPSEFSILALLASKPRHVFGVTDLCAMTKGLTATPAEARALVKQHIFQLRLKLEQGGKYAQSIENVRGQGYMWKQND